MVCDIPKRPKLPNIPRALQHMNLKNYWKIVALARQFFDELNKFQHYTMLDIMFLWKDKICENITENLTEVNRYFFKIYMYYFHDGNGSYYSIPDEYIRQYSPRGISG